MAKASLLDLGVLILIGLTAARANGILQFYFRGGCNMSVIFRESPVEELFLWNVAHALREAMEALRFTRN